MKKIELLSILAILFLITLRLLTVEPGCDNSHDSFYHVTMADLGPSCYMAKKFPPLSLSQWNKNFSDKELSFHLILSGIRKSLSFIGQPIGAPFHVEYMFFAFLIILSFVFTCCYFKIDKIFLYSMAFVTISPFFTTRLMVIRPHMLAISIILISCVLFHLTENWKRIWIPFLLGFVMSWSYSNPHFILLPAITFGLTQFNKNRKLVLAIPAATVLGIVIGYTIHPQFPNTFINWKIQCIDVVLISLMKNSPVQLGYELTPGNFNFFIENLILFLLFLLNTALIYFYVKKIKLKNINTVIPAFYFMSAISYIGIFASVRAVEYATPFSLITTGILIREYSQKNILHLNLYRKNILTTFAVFAVSLIFIGGGINYYKRAKNISVRPYSHFARWLSENNFPNGSLIGNVNWSDFPLLFYSAPQYRYLAGIDPMFAYYKNPDKIRILELFRTGKKYAGPEEIYQATGTRYIFVSHYNNRLSRYLFKKGYVSIYQGQDGNLFDLKLSLENMNK